nr:EOG090X080D [Eulimnadia texana]
MFSSSSQLNSWMYVDENEISRLREIANRKYIEKHSTDRERDSYFLTAAEERTLLQSYEMRLREFCRKFQPPMPRSVSGTAFHYMKRFYLKNSLMNYHPKEIMVTCVYLACKVDEFNVSMDQFVANFQGDRERAASIILNNELFLMFQLNYQLTVHNPFRPLEGFLIDIKTRSNFRDPERLRPGIDEFLSQVFLTDSILIYSPSQIALAAIVHAASALKENLDTYVTETLFGGRDENELQALIDAVRKVRMMVRGIEQPHRDTVKVLEKKLEICRNQEHNPESSAYKKRMKDKEMRHAENLQYSWLYCTRYQPPKLPRVKRDTVCNAKYRNPRIPFSIMEVAVLEEKFRQAHYLGSKDVAQLATALNMTPKRYCYYCCYYCCYYYYYYYSYCYYCYYYYHFYFYYYYYYQYFHCYYHYY